MSYYAMMKSIEEKIAASRPTKSTEYVGSGLLARSKAPTGSMKASNNDINEELAKYIMAIRKQKEEIINGKSQ